MRHAFRFMTVLLAVGFVFNLALAQRSDADVPEENRLKEGTREAHQGADNPNQGNRSEDGPYGSEDYEKTRERLERNLNSPQWQLDIDLHDPRSIVINYPDGTSQEYWYVMFRVINKNTRRIKDTSLPDLNNESAGPGKADPLEIDDNAAGEMEGVPVNCHLDFELDVFTRDIEKDPWDKEFPTDPEDEILEDGDLKPDTEGKSILEMRRERMKSSYRAVSDPFVLQAIARREGMWEWMGNYNHINEPVMLLHPLSDFQRQIGFSHDLSAPDLTGPRCFAYRALILKNGEKGESVRYVAVYEDNTYAGIFGKGDELPDGAHLVDNTDDAMWGKLSQRRYKVGDTVDRYGRILRANDPGYLNARVAGGKDPSSGGYGVLSDENEKVGSAALIPAARVYQDGDHVLDNWDTAKKHDDYPNETYKINGKIVSPRDARFGEAEEINSGTTRYGKDIVGEPVKMLDARGRAIKKYLVTYRAGDVLTQAEWDILRARMGESMLKRYSNTADIVGRALVAGDPGIGMPKIKLGKFRDDSESDNHNPEVLKRGVDTGRGPNQEIILEEQDYTTGRLYDPKKISPEDFNRDADGEFSTWRSSPVPEDSGLDSSQEYIYAPLGLAMDEDSVAVPSFDQYGVWKDYKDEVSESRIPLIDSEGKLVRDMLDQIQYLKEYEYEYVYMYEYARQTQDDEKFTGEYVGDQSEMETQEVRIKTKNGKSSALLRLVYEMDEIEQPKVTDAYMLEVPLMKDGKEVVDEDGDTVMTIVYLPLVEYKEKAGEDPAENAVMVKIITTEKIERRIVKEVHTGDDSAGEDDDLIETWEEAEARVTAPLVDENGIANPEGGYTVTTTDIITYVNENRNKHLEGTSLEEMSGVEKGHMTSPEGGNTNELELDKAHKIWRRWTVPPPVVLGEGDEMEVITRLTDEVGPSTSRFLTRYISEMWGVAIFKGVRRDWDFANVSVRGLRATVSNRGLRVDGKVDNLPNPADGGATTVDKTFLSPQYVREEWVYRTRYERLGDEYENFRDLIRRKRTFWYLDESWYDRTGKPEIIPND